MSCTVKIVVLGLGAVGKSALSIRFVNNTFVADYDPTIANQYKKTVTIDGATYNIDLLDTAGMEDQKALLAEVVNGQDVFILVYAINDIASFEQIPTYHSDIIRFRNTQTKDALPLIICANKIDLLPELQADGEAFVPTEDGEKLAQSYQAVFLETSAKTGQNVEEAMIEAVKVALKNRPPEPPSKKKGRCLLL